jgi:hypothetical protein
MQQQLPNIGRPKPIWTVVLLGILVIWGWMHSSHNPPGGASATAYSTANPGMDRRAVPSVAGAERIAGGFSEQQRNQYKRGIEHLANNHRGAGEFTINQIIWDENNREQARAQQRQELADDQKREAAASAGSGEKADMDGIVSLGSQSQEFANMVRGYTIDANRVTFQLDADYWNPMSDQDKTMFKRTMYNAWALTYKRHVGDDQHPILDIDDLNGSQIDSYY